LHLVPAPDSAAGVLGERSGETLLLGELVGTLLGRAEEFGDVHDADPRFPAQIDRNLINPTSAVVRVLSWIFVPPKLIS
jgi:hypothetical protein